MTLLPDNTTIRAFYAGDYRFTYTVCSREAAMAALTVNGVPDASTVWGTAAAGLCIMGLGIVRLARPASRLQLIHYAPRGGSAITLQASVNAAVLLERVGVSADTFQPA